MGYSTSVDTLRAQLNTGNLDALVRHQGCRWITPSGEASKFAYKIREALYIARLYPSQFPELAKASEIFTIEVVDAKTVQARIAKNSTEASVLMEGGTAGQGTPVHGLEKAGRAINSAGPQTEFTIIDTWVKAQPNSDPIHFPEAELSNQQLTNLWNWAQGWKPPLMLMVSPQSGITVSLVDREVEQYAWKPADAKPKPREPIAGPIWLDKNICVLREKFYFRDETDNLIGPYEDETLARSSFDVYKLQLQTPAIQTEESKP